MIRPEVSAVEGERTAREWNARQVFYLWRAFARIETRDPPIFIRAFFSAQKVDRSIDESVPADVRTDIDYPKNVSAPVEFENAMLVPLTQVKVFAVEAEIGAGQFRTGDAVASGKSGAGSEFSNVSVVIWTFPDGEGERAVR